MRPWFALLVVLLGGACAPRPPAMVATTLGSETVVTLDGQRTAIAGVLHGRVAMVSLWATWCDSCVREVAALNRLAALSASRGDALVIGVAVGESRASVDAFVRAQGVRYPQVVDEGFRLADALGQHDLPATLVVDRTGRIVYRGDALDSAGLAAFRETLGPAVR
jgi:cytochrome c biogenesis protein CcmG/thiol:disulfide interchange protein DsbE